VAMGSCGSYDFEWWIGFIGSSKAMVAAANVGSSNVNWVRWIEVVFWNPGSERFPKYAFRKHKLFKFIILKQAISEVIVDFRNWPF